ncbi:NDR1/HIN1-like protein 13 [Salvia hispanica]|uniref:NDR1/HIN1-like protein 13 n=1 Tax=Salvia hispanica TaxID=49212 RepID=UPI0020092F07|nr:NDR1/HIN1-like protein 13 [Salvia hispanica]
MTDRVYPAAKPTANGGPAANGVAKPTFPATKAQLYNANRPAYRPRPPRRGHRRSCCCSICLWTTLLIILLLLLAAAAAAVFYVVYRPQRPSFSVSSLQLARFNLTDTAVTSAFNATIIARNRNSDIAFFYDKTSIRILSGGVDIGDGSIAAFAHGKRNVTTLRASIGSSNSPIDAAADTTALKSSVKSRNLPLKIQLDTKVKVKIGKIKTKKVEIRVTCEGIRITIPSGKTASLATTSKAKCKVDPRIKIIKWTF